jgi:hypothetical protein
VESGSNKKDGTQRAQREKHAENSEKDFIVVRILMICGAGVEPVEADGGNPALTKKNACGGRRGKSLSENAKKNIL